MPTYFDSSLLLSLLLRSSQTDGAKELWENHPDRVSSRLIEVESLVALRRNATRYMGGSASEWLSAREEQLKHFLKEVTLKGVDEEVIETLWKEKKLGECRSIDAVHLATALTLGKISGEDFFLCTLDKKMASVGRDLGLKVLPV